MVCERIRCHYFSSHLRACLKATHLILPAPFYLFFAVLHIEQVVKMSKDTSFYMPQPTPPPNYRTPSLSEGLRPQHTGSSRSPYEYELNEIHDRQHAQPRAYDDAYYRWRRGAENDMPQRPQRNSKAANIFATLCCGSIWGVVAWIIGLILVVGGFTALLVKTMVQFTNQDMNTTTNSNRFHTLMRPLCQALQYQQSQSHLRLLVCLPRVSRPQRSPQAQHNHRPLLQSLSRLIRLLKLPQSQSRQVHLPQ